jgi:hypothetical protein
VVIRENQGKRKDSKKNCILSKMQETYEIPR